MRLLRWLIFLALLGGGLGLWLSRAQKADDARLTELAGLAGDAARGEAVFWAGGCASCHAAPGATGDDLLVLAGGEVLDSPFGAFLSPNISTDPDQGIGGWSAADLGNALWAGVSPEGRHYFPAFPYTSYVHMTPQDVADLKAFLDTLPASASPSQPHRVPFPFNQRRAVGVWKQLNLTSDWAMAGDLDTDLARGRYLAEGPGHCAECHTPRDALGGLDRARWMAGAPNPSGKGNIPTLTPDKLTWSAQEIAYYLETGFTPDYDSAGGHMARVVGNMARLTPQDRAAIAAYIKALPAP